MPTVKRRRGQPSAPLAERDIRIYPEESVRAFFAEWAARDDGHGDEMRVFCPVCEDPSTSKSPSASINVKNGLWNCAKSDSDHGGAVYDLVQSLMKERGTTIHGVAKAQRTTATSATKPTLPPKMGAEAEANVKSWQKRLHNNPQYLDYLTKERGLNLSTIKRAEIGWNGQRYTFPIRDSFGVLRNVRLHKRGGGEYKWLPTKGHGTAMLAYTVSLANEDVPVILAAGEIDALLTQQTLGKRVAVVTATGGEGVVPRDLSPLAGREVFVAYDLDEAGQLGATKAVKALRAAGATAYNLDLTTLGLPGGDGADLSDYWNGGGTVAEFRDALALARTAREARERFVPVSAADLAQPVPPMEWLVKGVWPAGSYGTLAGEKKTLKTYTDLALALAVASGEPFLGQFAVPEPRPVLMYLGEGGQIPTMHRVQRIAAAMGVDLASLPLRIVFDAGDITGEAFLAALDAAVADEMPGLVIVDPFYAYHPPGIEAQNLYDRGAMLAEVQQSMPPGCAFILADHFRKTGSRDLDLDSIAQSGVSQWADSWILQNHNSPARVDAGQFSIGMQFGSRQWGGRQYVVDWSLGSFNEDTGEHVGDLSYSVRSVEWGCCVTHQQPLRRRDRLNHPQPSRGRAAGVHLQQGPRRRRRSRPRRQGSRHAGVGPARRRGPHRRGGVAGHRRQDTRALEAHQRAGQAAPSCPARRRPMSGNSPPVRGGYERAASTRLQARGEYEADSPSMPRAQQVVHGFSIRLGGGGEYEANRSMRTRDGANEGNSPRLASVLKGGESDSRLPTEPYTSPFTGPAQAVSHAVPSGSGEGSTPGRATPSLVVARRSTGSHNFAVREGEER